MIKNNSRLSLKGFIEFCHKDGKIYFFKGTGSSICIEDKSRFIEAVCKLMDGRRTYSNIQAILLDNYPEESPYLEKLLQVLNGHLLLEDLDKEKNDLTDYDLTRWQRNIEFFNAHCDVDANKYEKQQKIKATKIALLGLGGVGSHILYDLACLGVHNIKAIDFDKVDLSNLNRQILYNETDIGHLKTDIARERILKFLPNASIDFINKEITSHKDIEILIQDCDFVISAVDKPRDSIIDWVNLACVKQKKKFICGAFDSQSAVYYSVYPGETGCIECWKQNAKKSDLLFQDFVRDNNFVVSSSLNVAIVPLVSVLTGLILNDLMKMITGIYPPVSLEKLCAYNLKSAEITIKEQWKKNPQCVVCSSI